MNSTMDPGIPNICNNPIIKNYSVHFRVVSLSYCTFLVLCMIILSRSYSQDIRSLRLFLWLGSFLFFWSGYSIFRGFLHFFSISPLEIFHINGFYSDLFVVVYLVSLFSFFFVCGDALSWRWVVISLVILSGNSNFLQTALKLLCQSPV